MVLTSTGSANGNAAFEKRINDVCYQHILPHLNQLNAEQDDETRLALMEPDIFSRFVTQATSDVGRVLIEETSGQFRRMTAHLRVIPDDVQEFVVCDSDLESLVQFLVRSAQGFHSGLPQYASEYQRFRQVVREASYSGWGIGANMAMRGCELFGLFGGVLATVAAPFVGMYQAEQQIDAAGKQFDQAFVAMCGSYDKAMTTLLELAVRIASDHYVGLTVAIQSSNNQDMCGLC